MLLSVPNQVDQNKSHFNWPASSLLLALALTVSLVGCKEPDQVRVTKVDPSRSNLDREKFVSGLGSSSKAASTSTPSRMIAAMIDRPDQTYFVKTMGASEQISEIADDFQQLLQSLRFSKEEPISWTAPEGWKEAKGGAMFRLATLTAPNGTEVTITSLTPGQELLPNINRWQGQLNLPPISQEQIDVQRIKVEDQEVILYDETGNGTSNSMTPSSMSNGGAPFANQPANSPVASEAGVDKDNADVKQSSSQSASAELPLELPEIQEGWENLPATASKVIRWKKGSGDTEIIFELLRFPKDAPFASMVGVWSSGIGVNPPPETGLGEIAEEVSIGSATGKWVSLPNEKMSRAASATDAKTALAVVRLDLGNDAWYFKWQGSESQLEEMKPQFMEFLKQVSVK